VKALLRVSNLIDAITNRIGHAIYWLILVSVIVSSGNAVVRYIFDVSSNGWLELQWYLFSAVFLIGAGYTLLHNQHVRIDIIIGRLPPRVRGWIDLLGTLLFLLPMALIILWFSLPMVADSYMRHEMSSDAGGLLRWPAKILIPIGFSLLILQAISELIKRIAFLMGLIPDPTEKHDAPPAVELSEVKP
jgi:TRAP-type mannitol/chloroaromatic compound transport system permease small subunit